MDFRISTIFRVFFVFIILLLIASCATLPEQVQKKINEQDFAGAREILEDEGVGELIEEDDEEALEARVVFEKGVEKFFSNQVGLRIELGTPQKAYEVISQAEIYCPWSKKIKDTKLHLRVILKHLNSIENRWMPQSTKDSLTYNEARKFSADLFVVYNLINERPVLLRLYSKSLDAVQNYWVQALNKTSLAVSEEDFKGLKADFKYFPRIKTEYEDIALALNGLQTLPDYQVFKNNKFKFLKKERKNLAQLLYHFTHNKRFVSLVPLYNVTAKFFQIWFDNHLMRCLRHIDVSFEILNVAEVIVAETKPALNAEAMESLRGGHLRRAKVNSGQGKSSLLSLVHLARYRSLGGETDLPELKKINTRILSSFKSASKILGSISVEVDPSIEVSLYEIVRTLLYAHTEGRTMNFFGWRWFSRIQQKTDLKISFNKIEFLTSSYNYLPDISSTYLSHHENIPNPMKDYYDNQADSAKFDVDSAKFRYDMAVVSHNSYPTQYSLDEANSAYSDYKMAIDTYNSAVRRYNNEPSVVSQAVYLPYSFKMGTVYHGWKISATMEVNGEKYDFEKNIVEKDFVRLGTKHNDRHRKYRQDDFLEIDMPLKMGYASLKK